MKPKIKIAVDAMGGENSPKKVINGILENYVLIETQKYVKIYICIMIL